MIVTLVMVDNRGMAELDLLKMLKMETLALFRDCPAMT